MKGFYGKLRQKQNTGERYGLNPEKRTIEKKNLLL